MHLTAVFAEAYTIEGGREGRLGRLYRNSLGISLLLITFFFFFLVFRV